MFDLELRVIDLRRDPTDLIQSGAVIGKCPRRHPQHPVVAAQQPPPNLLLVGPKALETSHFSPPPSALPCKIWLVSGTPAEPRG
jgi:hypothetical protein